MHIWLIFLKNAEKINQKVMRFATENGNGVEQIGMESTFL